jgi:hypothetical protein
MNFGIGFLVFYLMLSRVDCSNSDELFDMPSKGFTSISMANFSDDRHIYRDINLKGNKIESIEKDSFRGMDRLVALDLSENEISFIHPQAFAELVNLQVLDLGANKLSQINDFLFENLTKLDKLEIYGNKIASISSNAFRNLRELTLLDLSNNQLEKIDPASLRNLTSLTELKLSNNYISSKINFDSSVQDLIKILEESYTHFQQRNLVVATPRPSNFIFFCKIFSKINLTFLSKFQKLKSRANNPLLSA